MDMCDLFEMDLNEAICSLVPLDGLAGTDDTQTIVLISTPAQLLNGANASLCGHHFGIFVDGTHGMVLDEAQIVLIGTQDIRQKGHRIAAVIVPKAGLNTDLMACIFRHLKALVEAMAMAQIGNEECPPGYEWMVSSLLSDDEGRLLPQSREDRVRRGDGWAHVLVPYHEGDQDDGQVQVDQHRAY